MTTQQPQDAHSTQSMAPQLESPETLFKLGSALHQQGKLDEALTCLEKCVELEPNFPPAYLILSKIYRHQNRPNFAAASLILFLDYEPNSIGVLFDLGNLFAAYQDYDNAIIYFKRILEVDPSNGSARHAIAALSGETTAAAPPEHVQQLFDDLAASFESHLGELGYNAPEKLKSMLVSLVGNVGHFKNTIDLGCGTGLSGLQFKTMSTHLTGLDLSQKMVDLAREKNIYDQLLCSDICPFFEKSNKQYELILATDVFVYIGDLTKVFNAISAHSTPGAYFLFTTELSTENEYTLRPTGRYAHSHNHIAALAKEHGFSIAASQLENLRTEGLSQIQGELFVLQKLDN
ncbi:MAG: tetratricopeptide repeat protein [Gallionella sp.]|nr:tetratricopeptide repeat protein [Gallionella sp.]